MNNNLTINNLANCESNSGCLLNLGYVDSSNKNCVQCSPSKTLKFYEECGEMTCPSGTFLSENQCIGSFDVFLVDFDENRNTCRGREDVPGTRTK